MTDSVVIYHGPTCPDGFGAAFSAWLVLGNTGNYLPANYGDEPPSDECLRGKDVYIVDFSYPPEVIEHMASIAKSVTVLDHHATARDKLQCFCCEGVKLTLDMQKSGARLAWEFFHPGQPVPKLIAHVEDRDLWRWAYADSQAYLRSLDVVGFDFVAWKNILDMEQPERQQDLDRFIEGGRAMQAQYDFICQELAAKAFDIRVLGERGLAVNAPGLFASEVGNLLATQCGTFGLVFSIESPPKPGKSAFLKLSLRSNGFDVRTLAEKLGGGGHPQAAACRLPLSDLPALLAGTLPQPWTGTSS